MQGQKDHRRVGVCEATEELWSFLGGVGDRGAGHEFGGGMEHRRTDPWSGRAAVPLPGKVWATTAERGPRRPPPRTTSSTGETVWVFPRAAPARFPESCADSSVWRWTGLLPPCS